MLTIDEVKHLAKMSNLTLTEEEVEMYRNQLANILDYVKELNALDTENVNPTFHVANSINRFQDTPNYEKETLSNEMALKNAKKTANGYILSKSKLKG